MTGVKPARPAPETDPARSERDTMTEILTDTSTGYIAQRLVRVHETTAQTTGRVLTLIVLAGADENLESVIGTVKDASREHPSRVLVLLDAAHGRPLPDGKDSCIDAEIHVGGDAGASELVVIRMNGEVAEHPASVVTPLLLPDTPIVCWWPSAAPADPAATKVGRIAQRRIVDSRCSGHEDALAVQREHYSPGDSDLAWARITLWRAIVASTLDQPPHHDITESRISGPAGSSSVDLAAGWLADRLRVPVTRETHTGHGIRLAMTRADGELVIDQRSLDTVEVDVPGAAKQLVALNERSQADCLSEELRHLDPDDAYAGALDGIRRLNWA